nr:GIY-YIG nuclease family protein [uncultured Rhodoferax sp.]
MIYMDLMVVQWDDERSVAASVDNNARLVATETTMRTHTPRKTWVTVEGTSIDLKSYYDDHAVVAAVSYRTFWQRVRGLRRRFLLDSASLDYACILQPNEWITFYGGGRRRGFTYQGEQYPEHAGRSFSSIAALLRTIGRYGDRGLIWARLKAGWDLELALTIPSEVSTQRPGLIYKVVRLSTGQVYVGLTLGGLAQRWTFHLRAARRGSASKLATAIRQDGEAGFAISVLEQGIRDLQELQDRERHWVKVLDALGNHGLNVAAPGGLGAPRGKRTLAEGRVFRSLKEAAQVLAEEHGVPEYVAMTRIKKGQDVPDTARTHSQHPEAGSNLFRRWLALMRRHPNNVHSAWRESYDAFKADVGGGDPALSLVRLDDSRPWGPANIQWLSDQEKVERIHGTAVEVHGLTFPSMAAVARHFGIGGSTLKDRMYRQGLTLEQAVAAPAGATSYRLQSGHAVVDGKAFRSRRQAQLYLVREKGMTEHQARKYFQQPADDRS